MRKKLYLLSLDLFDFSKSSKATMTLVIQLCIGVCAMIGSLFLFLKLADNVIEQEVMVFDDIIIQFIYMLRTPFLTTVMKTITLFGGEIVLAAAIFVTILLLVEKHKKDAFVFFFLLSFGIILNVLLKLFFQRPRPTLYPLIQESSFSFPSGHAMNAFIFYTCLSFFIFRKLQNKRLRTLLIGLSILLILLIGLSRVYLGVHYPSDIIAGYAAGLLWFVIVLLFEKMLIFLKLFRTYELKKKY